MFQILGFKERDDSEHTVSTETIIGKQDITMRVKSQQIPKAGYAVLYLNEVRTLFYNHLSNIRREIAT